MLVSSILNSFFKMFSIYDFFFQKCSKSYERMEWDENRMKRMKDQFSDFYFLSYGYFCTQNMVNFWWAFTITQKKNRIFFSVFHSFQNVSQLFGPKNQNGLRTFVNYFNGSENPKILVRQIYQVGIHNI